MLLKHIIPLCIITSLSLTSCGGGDEKEEKKEAQPKEDAAFMDEEAQPLPENDPLAASDSVYVVMHADIKPEDYVDVVFTFSNGEVSVSKGEEEIDRGLYSLNEEGVLLELESHEAAVEYSWTTKAEKVFWYQSGSDQVLTLQQIEKEG